MSNEEKPLFVLPEQTNEINLEWQKIRLGLVKDGHIDPKNPPKRSTRYGQQKPQYGFKVGNAALQPPKQ